MSRLTAAQVIAMGDYLEPDFDPASLTVSQLLGVLGFHNIRYPTPYSKAKLVNLFNEEVKTRSAKFKKERLKKENSMASDDGITDGVTGQPIAGPKAPARRSSRRLSHAPIDEEETPVVVRPEPPKRRRSSAQPNLGGPSRRVARPQPVLAEESEPEQDIPVRKVGRNKIKSEAAGTHARRISQADDSGWEDNNIFQSGAESSSPAQASPARPSVARRSLGPRKSRKSMSAPPDINESPSPIRLNKLQDWQRVPQAPIFKPVLPTVTAIKAHLDAPGRSSRRDSRSNPATQVYASDSDKENIEEQAVNEPDELEETRDETNDGWNEAEEDGSEDDLELDEVTNDIVRHESKEGAIALKDTTPVPGSNFSYIFGRLLLFWALIATCVPVYHYKQELAEIGYCNTGTNTNRLVEERKARRIAVEACNKENSTLLYHNRSDEMDSNEACPLPPLVSFLHPERCTPCPEHATCSQYSVQCDTGYLLQPHGLLSFFGLIPPPPQPLPESVLLSSSPSEIFWKAVSLSDGLPGFGSIAFPPKCVEDPKRRRNVGVLGIAIDAFLGQERGRRLCMGGKDIYETISESEGGDAKKWGIEVEKLRQAMKNQAMMKNTPSHLMAAFDGTFDEAIQQLTQWGSVIVSEDQQGRRYLAHKTPNLTWDCIVTVKTREIWAAWRSTLLGFAGLVLLFFAQKTRRARQQIENKRIADLVQIALDTLRNQEVAHHTDPVTAPQVYLSSLQLRDLILQDEHSIPTRRRLWDQVEHIVEGNANVRTNLEEIEGGDELRVWRWVGNSGIHKLESS